MPNTSNERPTVSTTKHTKQAAPKAPTKKTKKTRKKRGHPVFLSIFTTLFCLFVAGCLVFVSVGSYVLSYINEYYEGESIINLDDYKNSQSQTSFLYYQNKEGKTIEAARLHGNENRIWVDYDQMPENLTWAFVCLEDKRFYDHDGVDWIRTAAVFVLPEYEGQGGSTITQQLIKNLTGHNENTFNRKFNEILRALNVERYYSKKDILEAYLNTVYLGAGAYGVKTAAETYFGKEVSDLSLAECAMLAGITKSPYSKNPYNNYEAAKARQELCLYYMLDEGVITEKQYNKAIKAKIKLTGKTANGKTEQTEETKILSWYEQYVLDDVVSDLQSEYNLEYNEAWHMIYYGGLNIYSAVDIDMQEKLEDIYENRSGFPYSRSDKNGKKPESAMTIMDYKGRILALVGGTGKVETNRAYNRATSTKAKRQPGSSIKPLSVYAPAMNEGLISPTTKIYEKAIQVDGKTWPRNFNGDHGSGDDISVQNALARSLNTVPARILRDSLGLDTALDYANNHFHLNLTASDKTYSALAVGGTYTGVTTLEMAAAFATFGNGGFYYEPYSYFKVVDRNGKVLLDNTKNEPEQVIETKTANSMLSMLKAAVTQSNGTGYGSKIHGFETFAKTGTTSDNYDKWYCGGTPYYVTAVWYGYDKPADLHTGSSNPAKTVFTYVFKQLHRDLDSLTFEDNLKAAGLTTEGVEKVHSSDDHDDEDKTTEEESTTEEKTTEETTAEKTTAEKTTVEKTTEEKTTAEKTTAEKTTAEKTTAEKTTAEKTTAEKTTAEKTTEGTTAEKTTAEKTTEGTTAERTTHPIELEEGED